MYSLAYLNNLVLSAKPPTIETANDEALDCNSSSLIFTPSIYITDSLFSIFISTLYFSIKSVISNFLNLNFNFKIFFSSCNNVYTIALYKFPPCNSTAFGSFFRSFLQMDVFPAPTSPSIPITIFSFSTFCFSPRVYYTFKSKF